MQFNILDANEMAEEKAKILWIDDEIELLKPHIILLEQRGYHVNTSTNGEDAIEMVRGTHYGLIFLDESMVGMSGLDTLPLLKQIDPVTPVVMVTKNEAESLMEEALGSKIDDYLTKPVNPAQILAACKKFIESERITQERLTQDYLVGFNEIRSKMMDRLDWQDWKEIFEKLVKWSIELDRHPELGFLSTLEDQWRECNVQFSKFIEDNYQYWVENENNADVPIMSPHINDKYLLPLLKTGKTTVFFVIDCLRADQWLVISELLSPYFSFDLDYYLSIIPTATPYARNAIFSGLFPIDIQKYYPQWWLGEPYDESHKQNAYEKELLEEYISRRRLKLKNNFTYLKIHETEFGKRVESDIKRLAKQHLTAIVVNAVDMIAHSRSDYAILKEIAPDEAAYRSLTRSWFQHSSLFGMLKQLAEMKDVQILLTTDHGSIRCMRGVKVLGDRDTTTCLRYKFGRNVKADERHAIQLKELQKFKLPKAGVTVNNIIAKEDYYFVYPTDYHHYLQRYRDSFQHGGVSLEEMIIPIVNLKQR